MLGREPAFAEAAPFRQARVGQNYRFKTLPYGSPETSVTYIFKSPLSLKT